MSREASVAVAAVLKACHVAQIVFDQLVKGETATKSDNSPVTVADYAAQALISTLLTHHFPNYRIVGEEDTKDLRSADQLVLRNKVVSLANEALQYSSPAGEDDLEWSGIGALPRSAESWLSAIDKGDADQTNCGRVWTLDPIDGTKGFLRGGQYAVCLALLEDGQPILGVIGCPNLPVDHDTSESAERGVLFVAEAHKGAYTRSLVSRDTRPISMRRVQNLAEAAFCESVEGAHSDQGANARIATLLGITRPPVRMDSQAKYCSISRGDGDIYLRLPTQAGYVEKIWDHAAGALLVAEAGGKVTDMEGRPLNFGLGRTLISNRGIVAAQQTVQPQVLAAVKKALSDA